jgi:GAF domain-containing protein/HAMP domain-containing protein
MNPFSRFFAPSIRRRILIGFVIVTLLVLVMAFASFFQLSQVRAFSEQIIPNSAQMGNLQSLALATSALDADLERFLVIRGAQYRDNVLKDLESMAGALDAMQTDTEMAALPAVQELKTITTRLQPEINALLDIETTGTATTDVNQQIVAVYADIDQAKQLQQSLSADTLARLQATAATQGRITSDVITQTAILGLAVFVIAVIASLLINRTLRPIGTLTETATAIAAGDLNRTAPIQSRDEIGTLASAFNTMTAQLRGMVGTLEDRVTVRTDQLRASAEVGRAASSILDADQLLHETVNVIAGRFGFYYVAVFTLDPNEQFAVLRAATGEAGRILLDRGHRLPFDMQSMVGAAMLNRHARIALDVGQEAVRFANPLLPNTRSEIALPLIVGQRAIGALDVQSERAGAFDEASADVLQAMADQIAIALQNAESFTRSEQQTQTLAVLNQLSRELALAADYEGIARALRTSVVNLIDPQQIALRLASSDPQRLTVYPLDLEREPVLGESRLVETARARAGDSLTSDQTLYVQDLTTAPDPYHENASLIQAGLRSTLIVPLRVGDKRLGTLNVGHDTPNAYSPEMINRMEQVAAQLAVALENLNLVEQTRQALNELDAANRRLIGQAWGKYLQASEQISAEWREGAWIKNADEKQKTAISIAPHQAANLQLPIKVRGQTIGEFSVMTAGTPHTWSEEDITFAQSLVDQAGQMIENTRLLEETERFAHREQRIREITTRIRAADDIQGVLEATAVELARSMGVSRAIVRLTTSESVRQEIQDSEQTDN